MCLDDRGVAHFEWLQQGRRPVTYIVFDVLHLDGHDLMSQPLRERRGLLEHLVEPGPNWRLSDRHEGPGSGRALLDETIELGAEGVVAKRLDSTYQPGKRSASWRKVKNRHRQEFVVGGFTAGTGARSSTFGSIAVGFYEGERLVFAGTAGSGFNQAQIDEAHRWFAANQVNECPFDPRPPRDIARTCSWCTPARVAEIAFTEWTDEGFLRHPVFLGWRDDKSPRDVTSQP